MKQGRGVSVKIDGIMVLTVVGIAGGLWLFSKRNLLNPFSRDNVINQTAEKHAIKGEINGESLDTHLFAAFDLLNPFNEDDTFAEKVFGIGDQE